MLVHCLDGLNLAPSIAAAYLMRTKSLDYDAALAIVQRAKPDALPAPHFEEQLRLWANMDCCIHDGNGQEKLPYVLWKLGMKEAFQRQQAELKALEDEAEIGDMEENMKS